MPHESFTLTGEQIRAARALARIDQAELAKRAGVSLETVKRLERIRGPVEANVRTLSAIVSTFNAIGIQFHTRDDGVGVCASSASSDRRPKLVSGAQSLFRIIYFSAAEPAAAAEMRTTIAAIHDVAMARNAELGVTGALFACNGRFLQVLEGPSDAVRQIYGAISIDPRHGGLKLLEARSVASRQFAEWSLCCGIFESDQAMFAQEPATAHGFKPELLTPISALGLLTNLRDLQALEPRCRRGSPGLCKVSGSCLDQTCACVDGLPKCA
jgi:transcriptional regulator with XRE-family HTH domain